MREGCGATPREGDGDGAAPREGDGEAPREGDGEAPREGDGDAPREGEALPRCGLTLLRERCGEETRGLDDGRLAREAEPLDRLAPRLAPRLVPRCGSGSAESQATSGAGATDAAADAAASLAEGVSLAKLGPCAALARVGAGHARPATSRAAIVIRFECVMESLAGRPLGRSRSNES
jgi:hypothetical protein